MIDDWLVDDMGAPPLKKRRHSEDLVPSKRVRAVQSARNVTQALGHGVGQEKGRRLRSEIVRQRCPNRKSVIELDSDSEDTTAMEEGEHGGNYVSTHADYWLGDVNDFSTLHLNDVNPFPPNTQQIPLSTQSTYSEQPIRVRVLIEGVHYLIPCPRQLEDATDTTVEWLAGKVAERYFIQHGRRPVLQLATSEGALLCSSDAVTDVVKEGEEVRVVVERWENPPLSECYLSACSRMTCG